MPASNHRNLYLPITQNTR